MYLWGRRWSPLDTCLPSWRCLRKFIADDLIIWGARTPPQWLPSPAVQYPSWWPQPSPPSNWHKQLTSRPILLSLFTLMVKLSQIWPVVACSRWLLCLCDLSVLFCEHFLTSWNSKLFQTHLILSLWKPRNESFFQEALTPLSEECYLFIYLFYYYFYFLAALGLCCCVEAFSSCGEQGLLFVAVHGLLIAVASLVAEHGLLVCRPQ